MGWFNYYGIVIITIIMIPNMIYAIKKPANQNNYFQHKIIEKLEMTGRIGVIAFMIFNIPSTYYGFLFKNALLVYLIINGVLLAIYLFSWRIFWQKNNLAKALFLSITPTCIFLFSGIMILSSLLIFFSIIFGVCHILISIKNVNQNINSLQGGNNE